MSNTDEHNQPQAGTQGGEAAEMQATAQMPMLAAGAAARMVRDILGRVNGPHGGLARPGLRAGALWRQVAGRLGVMPPQTAATARSTGPRGLPLQRQLDGSLRADTQTRTRQSSYSGMVLRVRRPRQAEESEDAWTEQVWPVRAIARTTPPTPQVQLAAGALAPEFGLPSLPEITGERRPAVEPALAVAQELAQEYNASPYEPANASSLISQTAEPVAEIGEAQVAATIPDALDTWPVERAEPTYIPDSAAPVAAPLEVSPPRYIPPASVRLEYEPGPAIIAPQPLVSRPPLVEPVSAISAGLQRIVATSIIREPAPTPRPHPEQTQESFSSGFVAQPAQDDVSSNVPLAGSPEAADRLAPVPVPAAPRVGTTGAVAPESLSDTLPEHVPSLTPAPQEVADAVLREATPVNMPLLTPAGRRAQNQPAHEVAAAATYTPAEPQRGPLGRLLNRVVTALPLPDALRRTAAPSGDQPVAEPGAPLQTAPQVTPSMSQSQTEQTSSASVEGQGQAATLAPSSVISEPFASVQAVAVDTLARAETPVAPDNSLAASPLSDNSLAASPLSPALASPTQRQPVEQSQPLAQASQAATPSGPTSAANHEQLSPPTMQPVGRPSQQVERVEGKPVEAATTAEARPATNAVPAQDAPSEQAGPMGTILGRLRGMARTSTTNVDNAASGQATTASMPWLRRASNQAPGTEPEAGEPEKQGERREREGAQPRIEPATALAQHHVPYITPAQSAPGVSPVAAATGAAYLSPMPDVQGGLPIEQQAIAAQAMSQASEALPAHATPLPEDGTQSVTYTGEQSHASSPRLPAEQAGQIGTSNSPLKVGNEPSADAMPGQQTATAREQAREQSQPAHTANAEAAILADPPPTHEASPDILAEQALTSVNPAALVTGAPGSGFAADTHRGTQGDVGEGIAAAVQASNTPTEMTQPATFAGPGWLAYRILAGTGRMFRAPSSASSTAMTYLARRGSFAGEEATYADLLEQVADNGGWPAPSTLLSRRIAGGGLAVSPMVAGLSLPALEGTGALAGRDTASSARSMSLAYRAQPASYTPEGTGTAGGDGGATVAAFASGVAPSMGASPAAPSASMQRAAEGQVASNLPAPPFRPAALRSTQLLRPLSRMLPAFDGGERKGADGEVEAGASGDGNSIADMISALDRMYGPQPGAGGLTLAVPFAANPLTFDLGENPYAYAHDDRQQGEGQQVGDEDSSGQPTQNVASFNMQQWRDLIADYRTSETARDTASAAATSPAAESLPREDTGLDYLAAFNRRQAMSGAGSPRPTGFSAAPRAPRSTVQEGTQGAQGGEEGDSGDGGEAGAWATVVSSAVSEVGTRSGTSGVLMAAEEVAPPQRQDGQQQQTGKSDAGDIDELADTVYSIIRRKLVVERERL